MPPPLVVSLLVLVSLPMVPWASRLTFDLAPGTESLDPKALAAFRTAADRWWSGLYDNVTIQLADSNSAAANQRPADLFTGVAPYFDNNADNIDRTIRITYGDSGAPGVPVNSPYPIGAATYLPSGYVWDLYASNAYVIETLNMFRDFGSSTSAGVMDFGADSRNRFLSVDIGITGRAQFANGGKFSDPGQAGHGKDGSGMEIAIPGAPAGRWLRIGHGDMAALDAIGRNRLETAPGADQLALCLIGLLAIMPSLLRRRGKIGGKRAVTSRRLQTGRYRIT